MERRNSESEPQPPRPPWRFGLSLPLSVSAAFILKAAAVLAISFLSYRGLRERAANADLTTRTLRALEQLESVLSTVKDAETGQRGYLLAGEARYLEPYRAAIAAIPGEMAKLGELVSDDPVQRRRLQVLERVVGEKTAEVRHTLDLQRAGRVQDAVAEIRTDRGKTLMDAIRSVGREMEDHEQGILQASAQAGRDASGVMRATTFAGAFTILFLLAMSAVTTGRAFRDREVQLWLRAGQTRLGSRLQGEQPLGQLGANGVRAIAEYLDAQVGVLYVAQPDESFRRVGAYAIPARGDLDERVKPGEGLLGQAIRNKRVLQISDVPDGYLSVSSGLGAGAPRQILIAPAFIDGEVNAVVELGFWRGVGQVEVQMLERAAESIAIAFRSARYREQQAELLEESQRQAEELHAQQEELRSSNQELESQQLELEEANAQLEDQARTLESQKEGLVATQRLLKQKAEDIDRVSRYKSEFLANMSHELRTPLNSSLILAKLLADNKEGNLTPEQVRYAQSISAAGAELLTIVNDVLDLAKVEAGRMDLDIRSVSVGRLLGNLLGRFEPLATERRLELALIVDPGCPETIETDPQRLQQALTNLLSNAVKFTEEGSIRLRAAPRGSGGIEFAVEDTGIGIPPSQHEVIFEAFRQADGTTSRKYGGTGLGLAICRELVTLLGGELHLRSTPGEGSAFTVVLPRRVPPRTAQQSRGAPAEPPTGPARAAPVSSEPFVEDDRGAISDPRRVVLIVEDDPAFANILRDLGRELNFQCVVAGDAAQALKLASEHRPVAVVLDIGLPDQSGLSVLELLKRDPSTRHVPVHMVSAHDYRRVALEMGAVGYALKPVEREELVSAFRVFEDRLSRKMRALLIVEDDPVQREAITALLATDGVEIVAAENADEALVRLRAATFDCCVLDLMLPGASGFELLDRMAEDETCSFPAVIVYTARSLAPDEEQRLRRLSKSIIIKGARSPERLIEEVTLFLHQVESDLPPEHQRMLRMARDREKIFEGRRILLVEDDVRSIFALSRAIEPKGLVVEIARNGKEALARLATEPRIDLVLIDIMMPEMDGLEATREIRKAPDRTALPIIALTAKAMPDDRQRCLSAGASDYIAKPVDIDKLISLLRVWMPR